MTTIASWNVNGVRAVSQKGMLAWLQSYKPDILCIQEIKASLDQLGPEILDAPGYMSYWASAQRKGYSGVATYARKKPASVSDLHARRFDVEGRTQILEYAKFTLVNAYFPNSREGGARLDYKLDFCTTLLRTLQKLRRQGRNVIVCGDFNIAHTEIDLANPKQNEKNPGYLPEERTWMSAFLKAGYVDTFRLFNTEGGHYTWWSYRFNARAKNIGWRIDYFCVNKEFAPRVKQSVILGDVMGSDHCPIAITVGV